MPMLWSLLHGAQTWFVLGSRTLAGQGEGKERRSRQSADSTIGAVNCPSTVMPADSAPAIRAIDHLGAGGGVLRIQPVTLASESRAVEEALPICARPGLPRPEDRSETAQPQVQLRHRLQAGLTCPLPPITQRQWRVCVPCNILQTET